MKRIHIVGSGPRTGTTLLHEVMVTCFEIDHFCDHEQSLFCEIKGDDGIFLTKKPGEFMSVRWPLFFDEDLYVICIVRDPRDAIVSIHGSRPDEYWTGLKFWKKFITIYERLKKNKRFIVIRYEDFTINPDGVQDFIAKQLPFLKKKCSFSEYHKYSIPSEKSLKAMREMRPIEPKGVGNWRNHLPRVKQQIKLHGSISKSLIQFGFEGDTSWEKELTDIPDMVFYGKKKEFFSISDLLLKKRTAFFAALSVLMVKVGFSKNALWNTLSILTGKGK